MKSVWIACFALSTASPGAAAWAKARPDAEALPADRGQLYVGSLGGRTDELLRLATLGVDRCGSLEARGLSGRVIGDLRAFAGKLRDYARVRGIDLERIVRAVDAFERRVRGSRAATQTDELRKIPDVPAFEQAYLAALEPALASFAVLIDSGRDVTAGDPDLRPMVAELARDVAADHGEAVSLLRTTRRPPPPAAAPAPPAASTQSLTP
jgi:hypothetical protein